MTLAFYAPLKPPTHATPSGDRQMARGLMLALEKTGAKVILASSLRSRDGAGVATAQNTIMDAAKAEAAQLITRGRAEGWRAWITYHNYYKAPDLLGPVVSKALNIPYLQIESTRARKRLAGPWAAFAKAAEAAADAADVIFYLTSRDGEALLRDAPERQKLISLKPFLTQDSLPPTAPCTGPMLVVGMMREGDKVQSYRLIADTLALLPMTTWHLDIVGDGPMRADVERMFTNAKGTVTFHGACDPEELTRHYASASLLLWPGVNEAFGMTYLEAQSHGLPVVAQNRPGVCDVLAPGDYPEQETGAAGLAALLGVYLKDPAERTAVGQAAQTYVARDHLLSAATATLQQGLTAVGVTP